MISQHEGASYNVISKIEYIPLRSVLEALNISRSHLYTLIRKKLITPYYIGNPEDGSAEGKPFFKVKEINDAFVKKTEK